jgi:aerobic-type carbon monoxide dehydrogenase small subunit (CoxS/CutS family)
MSISLSVNGQQYTLDIEADTPLLWVLRDTLGLTGTKYGCGVSLCGACTVHVDGKPVRSCRMKVSSVGEREVTTIEGLSDGGLNAVQRAWIEEDVVQCGYCQSGQVMAATALLAVNPNPSDADIDDAMKRNICRCGVYQRIRKAVHRAAELQSQEA